jgi:hypothetical protein
MRIIKVISIIIAIAFAFASCDKVEPPYQSGFDCSSGNKKVLIEDYTGHTCVNCPGAAVTAHEIQSNCEERIIIISVHAGFFAEPLSNSEFEYDFRTEAGEEWNNFFGIVSNPNGLVNRVNYDGNYVLSPGKWAEEANKVLAENSPVNINIFNNFNPSTNKLTTKVDGEFVGNVDGNYNLIVCLTENHIIKPQKNNDASIGNVGTIMDYEHMHVLRKVLNGNWGESFINGSATSGQTITKTYELSFDGTDWNADNCNIVAFICNVADKSVMQVNESPLTQ